MNDVIFLIQKVHGVDTYGDPVDVDVRRRVFAELASVGSREFYEAAATGLKPELKFMLQDYLDYQGEQIVEHEGTRYRVLRTYRAGQRLELTVYREVNPA